MYIIIGLDLSFNSTGITCTLMNDDNRAEKLMFGRVVFDNGSNKNFKNHININTFSYKMPDITTPESLVIDEKDENNVSQISSTLRAMMSAKKIYDICHGFILRHKSEKHINTIVVCIENYIMPSFGGKNSLPEVSGLITLQAYIREYFIRYATKNKMFMKMLTPSPSTVKKMFASNGKAEKEEMMKSFIERYDGVKLLPTISEKHLKDLNDVIDSFAMNCYAYKSILDNPSCLLNEF